jgi:hypothetical protein
MKDSIIERFQVGSFGVCNSGDRVAHFSSRDPVRDSYSFLSTLLFVFGKEKNYCNARLEEQINHDNNDDSIQRWQDAAHFPTGQQGLLRRSRLFLRRCTTMLERPEYDCVAQGAWRMLHFDSPANNTAAAAAKRRPRW